MLKRKIKASGYKQKYIYETLGITKARWYRIMRGAGAFTNDEMCKLCRMLNITSAREKLSIFLPDV